MVLGVGAMYAHSYYLERQATSDPWLASVEAAWLEGSPTAEATAEPATPTPSPRSTLEPTATATPSPTATPRVFPEAVGMRIPAIDLDSKVVEVGIEDGEYAVPRFVVGHYEHTGKPGERGNGVYTGHVESVDKGQIFADLPSVKPGDEIALYTREGIWRYEVTDRLVVPNSDVSVMDQTDDHRITLITCTGTFDWSVRQYTHRLVVVAKLINTDGPTRPQATATP